MLIIIIIINKYNQCAINIIAYINIGIYTAYMINQLFINKLITVNT